MTRLSLLLLLSLLCACSSASHIDDSNPLESYQTNERSALALDQLSDQSQHFLQQRDLAELFEDKPQEAIKALVPILKQSLERAACFTIAEACYLEVRRAETRAQQARLLCTALVYSYTYLFEERLRPATNKYDPSFRRACEIYNRCLGILVDATNKNAKSKNGSYSLPLISGESVRSHNGVAELAWDPRSFSGFYVCYDYSVEGVGPLNRFYGVGAPCIALRSPSQDSDADRYLAQVEQAYACTVFVRFQGSVLGNASAMKAAIEIYDPLKTETITVNGQEVPLEADLTTPLVYMFENAPRPKKLTSLLDVEAIQAKQGLYMLQPYDPEKIPLVFVHGLLSTQITWLKMMNAVLAHPRLRQRYQIWFFFYPTGNPILISAAVLRKSLLQVREAFDSKHKDSEFDQMVVVGHSMGGVLSRYMIQSSGQKLWNIISEKPLESYKLDPKQRQLIQNAFFFEPVPHIRRVIFLAAPHRGSALADSWLGSIANWLTAIPQKTLDSAKTLATLVRQDSEAEAFFRNPPSGVRSLSPGNPINKVGVKLPISRRVKFHSIMGNTEAAGEVNGSDGVVTYKSSHLDKASSELVVKSGHSVHATPKAILEVRRILLRHLDQRDRQLRAQRKMQSK